MDKENNNYTSLQIDAIKELINIGGGNAATSISKLIEKPVAMDVPTIEILSYEDLFKRLPEDEKVSGVIIKIEGDGEGSFLFITTLDASHRLAAMMFEEGIELNEDLCDSAIKELVNIIVSSYFIAISKETGFNLRASIPILIEEMFGAILSSVYIETEQYDEDILIIKNEFFYREEKIDSSLYFVPKPGVLGDLFNRIGI